MMTKPTIFRFGLLVGVNVLGWCVLSLQQASHAQNQDNLPFANAVQQRQEIIAELKVISGELKNQNALLRSGKLKVIVENTKTK